MAGVIMIQGTASNAGKSLITAGLCRIFRQDGLRTAPFKAQNMALNSFITADGREMGRAQVMQAEAAGIPPDVRMNPILLKPTSDRGSQVIVNGEVQGNMTAVDYYRYKDSLRPAVKAAYESLAADFDVVVIEGAGSPAEINLKSGDLVNMGMARMAQAPVLLVGDIDRGGVFAALAGTMLLLDEEERSFVKGIIINKFRGDPAILEPGLRELERVTGVPVLGVVPYLQLSLDDEDSLTERFGRKGKGAVDIAVPRLPRISNFTDLGALEAVEGVSVRYIDRPGDFGAPDLVVLPGTKNTMADLLWLRQSGLEAAVQKHASRGGAVIGICGGYQMLGQTISDPEGVEHGGTMAGLGLLPACTVFAPQKRRTRVRGRIGPIGGVFAGLAGTELEGYEIHMGVTTAVQPAAALSTLWEEGGAPFADGLADGNVYGSYVHGLFDLEGVARGVIRALMAQKGLDPGALKACDMAAFHEQQYDLLAEHMRASLNMQTIHRILERGMGR